MRKKRKMGKLSHSFIPKKEVRRLLEQQASICREEYKRTDDPVEKQVNLKTMARLDYVQRRVMMMDTYRREELFEIGYTHKDPSEKPGKIARRL